MHAPFAELIAEFSRAINHLSAAEVEAHPRGDSSRWNTRQIVEHLALTYRVSGENLQTRLEKGRSTQYRPSLAQRSAKLVLLHFGYFPHGRPAPAAVTPLTEAAEAVGGADLLALFGRELETVDGILKACEGHFEETALATHQLLGPLSVAEWRRFHVIHARHHLKRIRGINRPAYSPRARSLGPEAEIPVDDSFAVKEDEEGCRAKEGSQR
jgi:hypothetical protein